LAQRGAAIASKPAPTGSVLRMRSECDHCGSWLASEGGVSGTARRWHRQQAGSYRFGVENAIRMRSLWELACQLAKTLVGAGLLAIQATRCVLLTAALPSPASWLLQVCCCECDHCGSWLASEAVYLAQRGAAIASKPAPTGSVLRMRSECDHCGSWLASEGGVSSTARRWHRQQAGSYRFGVVNGITVGAGLPAKAV
ncbi:MAG: hypothetical protein JWP42_4415, partial [Pseudomonas sp.]|nr:hypothetical protein [Pseudomonas sp.]